jgi:hypothetical protein
MTDSNVDTGWAAYEAAEQDRIRDVSLSRLRDLITKLDSVPMAERFAWARDVARQSVDQGMPTPIRIPLFREVLFPALLAGVEAQHAGCARWLAGFSQLLYKSPDCQRQLRADLRSEIGLLREALVADAGDELARSRLIKAIRWQPEYSLHEVPAGVLYGHDGASIQQCGELQAELDEFENLVEAHGARAAHEDLIEECRYHYAAYPAYLARRSEFRSYEDYLAKTGAA